MKLADLRKLAIRRQLRIRFSISNGMECLMTEHGVARVPELKGAAVFNLEDELASAREFRLEPAASGAARTVAREELESMIGPAAAAAAHEDE